MDAAPGVDAPRDGGAEAPRDTAPFPDAPIAVDAPAADRGKGGKTHLLPWTANKSFKTIYAHNQNTHTGRSLWAWDFEMPIGTPILAAHDGIVYSSKTGSTRGGCSSSYYDDANFVFLDKGDGKTYSYYGHLRETHLKANQTVTRGDLIGYSGLTGYTCGPHLHFHFADLAGQSFQSFFHDTGMAYDPPQNSNPVSKNGVLDIP